MSEQQSTTGALVRHQAGTLSVITTPDEFRSYLQAHDDRRFHVLTPQADFGALPPQWTIVPSIVKLDPNPDAGDVYKDNLFCKGDEIAPTKLGLRKIARGAGMTWTTRRIDSGHVPYYWAMSSRISYRGFDGQMKDAEASYEWDLRDGSPRVAGMSAKELNRARLNGYRRCEAGAINAAIREYGLKQKYTRAELEKPFVVFNLVFQPDMSDPQTRAMVTQAALTGANSLYGHEPRQLPPGPGLGMDDDDPPIDTTARTVSSGGGTSGRAEASDFDDLPPEDKAAGEPTAPLYVVTSVQRQNRDASGRSPLYFVHTRPEATFYTEVFGLAQAAKDAKQTGEKVAIEAEQTADGLMLLELQRLPSPTGGQGASSVALPEGATLVAEITSKTGTSAAKDGKPARPWTRWTIAFATGESGGTFSSTIAELAQKALNDRLPVRPKLEDNTRYPDQQDLADLTLVDTRQAALPMESEL